MVQFRSKHMYRKNKRLKKLTGSGRIPYMKRREVLKDDYESIGAIFSVNYIDDDKGGKTFFPRGLHGWSCANGFDFSYQTHNMAYKGFLEYVSSWKNE